MKKGEIMQNELTDLGFQIARLSSKYAEKQGYSEKSRQIMLQLDEIALQLFRISEKMNP